MNIPGAVQVITPAPNTLQVHFPFDYIGTAGLTLGLLFVVGMTLLAHSRRLNFFWVGIGLSLFSLFFTLDTACYRGTLTLSKPDQALSVQESSFYYTRYNRYPLSSVEQAVVKAGRYQNKELALILSSGEEVTVGNGYTTRAGMFPAAQAINSFLSGTAGR